jgi:hypothetical protein
MGQFARCHISHVELRHPEPAISETFQETSVDLCTSYLYLTSGLSVALSVPLGSLHESSSGPTDSQFDSTGF